MRKSGAQRQREYRARLKARQAAASGAPTPPQNAAQAAPEPASSIVRRPLAEAGTCGLFLDGPVMTICDGNFAYSATLSPHEMLGLGLRLLRACGVAVELTAPDADRPRPMSVSTPIAAIRPQGNA